MGKGYTGSVMFVDLSAGVVEAESLPEKIYREFLGGEGLGVRILWEKMQPQVDPLGPGNVLGFAAGLLTGTPVPMTGRYTAFAKSPLTSAWGQANSGGYFGPALKQAGYDAVFFMGISSQPVYLLIQEGKAELRDASHLWGKDTTETEEILRRELGGRALRVASIGPAGEARSLISCVINDRGRAAARSGMGAVMGAKRLKAIAVRGKGRIETSGPDRIEVLRQRYLEPQRNARDFVAQVLKTHGTCGAVTPFVLAGEAPIKNWNFSGLKAFPNAARISDDNVTKYQVRKFACYNCPVGCGGIVRVEGGPYALKEGHKPEYETLAAFGTMCLNDNVESIIKANDICNRYGLDTMSAGAVIAFAMECYEHGLIGVKETEGIELTWGNAQAIIAILSKIAKREGIGDVLSDGVKKAAERIGGNAVEHAIHVGGQEPGFRDPRFSPGRLGYIADATPGRHTSSTVSAAFEKADIRGPYFEIGMRLKEFQEDKNRDKLYTFGSKYQAVVNCSGLCVFAIQMDSISFPLIEFVSAVTGWDYSLEEAITTGHRIQTLRQAFLIREGVLPKDIRLPNRMLEMPSKGPPAINVGDFENLRANFYEAMGWEGRGSKTGHPLPKTIKTLGLEHLVAKQLI